MSLWSFCVFGKKNRMEHINDFETYLRENGKAEKTTKSYTGDVREYIRFLSEKGIDFVGELNRFAINKKLNSLQSFNIHLIESGKMTDSVINLGRTESSINLSVVKPPEIHYNNPKA